MFNKFTKINQKGFTLIELLVVISIVSILSSVLIVAIDPKAQIEKADDAKRLTMINQLQKALDMYAMDNGHYPQFYRVHTWGESSDNYGYKMSEFKEEIKDYMTMDLDTDLWAPTIVGGDPGFYYSSSPDDNYQHYGIMISLISPTNTHYEENDGGYYSTYYEIGPDPIYCKNKYSGSSGNWWPSLYSDLRCRGGN